MTFLFGDLTPTPFGVNYLEVLRDAIDFAAAIAAADQQIVTAEAQRDALRRAADAEAGRLTALVRSLIATLDAAEKGGDASPTAAFAADLSRIALERLETANAAVTMKLGEDIRAVEAATLAARTRYESVLARYVLTRSPPDTAQTLRLFVVGRGKDEYGYAAELAGRSDLGLQWTIEIAIAEGSPWAKALRVDRVADGLTIVAPQKTGLIKKEVKPKKQKLERHFVTKLVDDMTTTRIDLRAEIGEPTGFEISANLEERLVTTVKTGEEGDPTLGPFATAAEDKDALLDLAGKLRATALELPKERLVGATYDELPFDGTNTDAQPLLVDVVSRVVAKFAPVVKEIAARSRSEDELVLRRVLADGHREEIFLPKAALREKIAMLDAAHRALFAPLDLDATPGATAREAPDDDVPPASVRSEVPQTLVLVPEAEDGPSLTVGLVEMPSDVPPEVPVSIAPPEVEKAPPEPEKAPPEPEKAPPEPEKAPPSGRNPELIATLKHIRSMLKDGRGDEAYRQYASLFVSPTFTSCRPEDQRQALKLMILAKPTPPPTDELRAAHRAALGALQAMVLEHRDPADYELLGVAYVALDEPGKATEIFKKALDIERSRNPASDLCGNLMRRVSEL